MRMTDEEIAAKVLRRAGVLRKRYERRRQRFKNISMAAAFFTAVIPAWLALWPPGLRAPPDTFPATALLPNGAIIGGYALTGVSCFTLGAAATLTLLKHRGNNKNTKKSGNCETHFPAR